MKWREPVYLWTELIPLMILVGSMLAERHRRRRLTTFGEPRLLGISLRSGRQILSLALLIIGIAATAAVLPLPVRTTLEQAVPGSPLIAIVLDARLANSSLSEVGYSMDEIEDLVNSIVEQAPGAHFALFRSGEPIEKVAPVTSDEKGLSLLVAQLTSAWETRAAAALDKSIRELATLELAAPFRKRRIVVVTAEPVEELPDLKDRTRYPDAQVLFVRVATSGSRIEAPPSQPGRNWVWGDQVNEIRFLLRDEQAYSPVSGPGKGNWCYIQIFAALGLFSLLGYSALVR